MDIEKILKKVERNGKRFQGKVPHCHMNEDGKYGLCEGGSWTDGFYPGVLNLAYVLTGKKEFLDYSREYDKLWDLRIMNTKEINEKNNYLALDHDVGFIFLPSCGFFANNFQDEKAKQICISAADTLVKRFHEKGKFIRAFNTWSWDTDPEYIQEKKGKSIIDSMMNLSLLFQVTEWTGDKKYYNVGYSHAKTTAKYFVRQDGSTYHNYNFNPETGEPVGGKTGQGYSDNSCWSRGQAWGIYGFALTYKYTKDEMFLDCSKKLAKYFMDNLSGVDMPCWDFSAKSEAFAPWDSSAAAICASGLLELSDLTEGEEKEYFRSQAERLLEALDKWCSTEEYPKMEPILLHGCIGSAYREHKEKEIVVKEIQQALTYGDYFYLESILKMTKSKVRIF